MSAITLPPVNPIYGGQVPASWFYKPVLAHNDLPIFRRLINPNPRRGGRNPKTPRQAAFLSNVFMLVVRKPSARQMKEIGGEIDLEPAAVLSWFDDSNKPRNAKRWIGYTRKHVPAPAPANNPGLTWAPVSPYTSATSLISSTPGMVIDPALTSKSDTYNTPTTSMISSAPDMVIDPALTSEPVLSYAPGTSSMASALSMAAAPTIPPESDYQTHVALQDNFNLPFDIPFRSQAFLDPATSFRLEPSLPQQSSYHSTTPIVTPEELERCMGVSGEMNRIIGNIKELQENNGYGGDLEYWMKRFENTKACLGLE